MCYSAAKQPRASALRLKVTMLAAAIAASCQPLTSDAGQLCANPRSGTIATRAKCKPTETALSVSSLASLLNPKTAEAPGIDIASCAMVEAYKASENGAAGVGVQCDPGEFLLNYGYNTLPLALQVPRLSQLGYDSSGAPNSVIITVQEEIYIQTATGTQQPFVLHVSGTCCPKAS